MMNFNFFFFIISYYVQLFAGPNYLGFEYKVDLWERLVTCLLILATLLSVLFLFYYQNFTAGVSL
jgi:hypothetical protein